MVNAPKAKVAAAYAAATAKNINKDSDLVVNPDDQDFIEVDSSNKFDRSAGGAHQKRV